MEEETVSEAAGRLASETGKLWKAGAWGFEAAGQAGNGATSLVHIRTSGCGRPGELGGGGLETGAPPPWPLARLPSASRWALALWGADAHPPFCPKYYKTSSTERPVVTHHATF